ncbi:MAG TPA: hypothetical protein DCZ91_01795, partial [Lachnospiraceae bacterium]|nr:hypothetical protein [Lachnospiraceae bacterium]
TRTVPTFDIRLLVLMVSVGILGGAAGRVANRRMDEKTVSRLFMGLMVMIMLISIRNMVRFM